MIWTVEDLVVRLQIGEDADFEAKDAEGGLPKDLWPTYSAFANTSGGLIILGIREHNNVFTISGLTQVKIAQRKKELWDLLNSHEKVSANLLSESNVSILNVDGKSVLIINVPQASRRQRPVYINGNPLVGTYKRNYQGDYRCKEDEVRRMLRDSSNESFDNAVLQHYDISEIDTETLNSYRNRFKSQNPDHPWLGLDDKPFLANLCAWRHDREQGIEGLTTAGLLMFGRERSIRDIFPHYHVDYQERLSDDPDIRWTDRISLDGRWEGNLYNYYFRVISALTRDLKIPFKLEGLRRQDDTHVHQALREALVNQIVHADYSGTQGLLTIKQKTRFIFVNSGRLRLSIKQYYHGGLSDCRNPNLQGMFRMIGLGERAGSGVSKILRAWQEQHWILPSVEEHPQYELTRLILPTLSLVPTQTLQAISGRLGPEFDSASELERLAMVMEESYGKASNAELQRVCQAHPTDIGKMLKSLVDKNWLIPIGRGRGVIYVRPGGQTIAPLDLFTLAEGENSAHLGPDSAHLGPDSTHLGQDSAHLGQDSAHLIEGAPLYQELQDIAKSVREKGKISKDEMESTILALCAKLPLSVAQIAEFVRRKPRTIQVHYLARLVREGRLVYGIPAEPNHPRQTYVTVIP